MGSFCFRVSCIVFYERSDNIMLTYLLIGLGVQFAITASRIIRQVATFEGWTCADVVLFVVLASINVILWPITIGFEVYNVSHGI